MAKPRKHHYVQQAHLDLFTDSDSKLSVFKKDGHSFNPTTGSIFAERDLYTYHDDEGINVQFEEAISKFEDISFPVVRKIAENGILETDDLQILLVYIALSQLRNPTFQKYIQSNLEEVTKLNLSQLEHKGEIQSFALNDHPWDGKQASELIADGSILLKADNLAYLHAIQFCIQDLCQLLSGFKYSLLRSPSGRVAIGDCPYTSLHIDLDSGPYGMPPGGGNCECTFPISKDYCLIGKWQQQLSDSNSEDFVKEVNRRQALFATNSIASQMRIRKLEGQMLRYSKLSYKYDVQSMSVPGDSGVVVARKGIFPSDLYAKYQRDFVQFENYL